MIVCVLFDPAFGVAQNDAVIKGILVDLFILEARDAVLEDVTANGLVFEHSQPFCEV